MSPSTFTLLFLLTLISTTTTTAASTCKSQTFKTPNKSFSTCNPLPHLSATLHWTFTPSTSTLSMAYTASPSKPSGWVAWAINPLTPAMSGSQALLAFVSSNGSVSVSTYNLVSYSMINKAPISYNVTSISGEVDSKTNSITIFGTWKLPEKTESINQVWQVGPSVTGGRPDKHDFMPANLNSKGMLELMESAMSPASTPAAMVVGAPAPATGKNGAGEMMRSAGVVWLGLLMMCLI